jgi:divalent metal cation (Fe/Co/Zn/Cd) transporter
VVLARANLSLLIGRSVPADIRARVRSEVLSLPHITEVGEVLAVYLGPAQMLVAVQVDFDDTASAAEVEQVADEVERRVRGAFPGARYVLVDPTSDVHV